MAIRPKRQAVNISSELAKQLKEFAEKKHGRIHGVLKYEAELAIRNHIAQAQDSRGGA